MVVGALASLSDLLSGEGKRTNSEERRCVSSAGPSHTVTIVSSPITHIMSHIFISHIFVSHIFMSRIHFQRRRFSCHTHTHVAHSVIWHTQSYVCAVAYRCYCAQLHTYDMYFVSQTIFISYIFLSRKHIHFILVSQIFSSHMFISNTHIFISYKFSFRTHIDTCDVIHRCYRNQPCHTQSPNTHTFMSLAFLISQTYSVIFMRYWCYTYFHAIHFHVTHMYTSYVFPFHAYSCHTHSHIMHLFIFHTYSYVDHQCRHRHVQPCHAYPCHTYFHKRHTKPHVTKPQTNHEQQHPNVTSSIIYT